MIQCYLTAWPEVIAFIWDLIRSERHLHVQGFCAFSLRSYFSLLIFFYIQQTCVKCLLSTVHAWYQSTFLRWAQFGGEKFAWEHLQWGMLPQSCQSSVKSVRAVWLPWTASAHQLVTQRTNTAKAAPHSCFGSVSVRGRWHLVVSLKLNRSCLL